MGKLDGKVALVTGAARGQGRSHAVTFAREGADVIITDLCGQLDSVKYGMAVEDDLAETQRAVEETGRRAVSVVADVREPGAMADLVQQGLDAFGRIDVVAANAGISTYGPLWEFSQDEWDEAIGVNLTGVWQTFKAVVPQMIERGEGGSIIATASCAGLRGFGNASAYTASKHGVVGLVRSLAIELAPHSIRVNVVCPFSVETPMILNEATYDLMTGGQDPTYAAARDVFASLNLLPIPWVQPEDVSNAYLFLASDDSRYITGLALPVDAGYMTK
jgi:(+)-trans-carveol dehydrogenase